MATNGKFGTLTIKNNGERGVIQNCILNVGVNIIGSSVNANVRLYDTNIDEQQCIVEVKEDGLVTIAALHIFPQTKINNVTLLKNRKVVLKNGDVLKIANIEIIYNNDSSKTCNQTDITKQIKQKIFPFTTPRRRSCNVTSSSAKKAPSSSRFGMNSKQSLFSPSPLIVKKNLPPKHNDDWPSEPLDHDQFPFVGHFSPQKKERPLQEIPEAMSALDDISLKPSSPSLVNVVAPTVRTSTCTSTSDFEKKKNEETMVPDVKSEISINMNDASIKSFHKPTVCVSARLSGRKSSLPAQNTNPKTSRRQNRSSSCVTPSKVSIPLKSRLTCSEHKLSNESQPSFLISDSIEMDNLTTSLDHENSEMNSSTPTSASRTSRNLTLLGTPTSIIKNRESILNKSPSLNKTDKTINMDNSEAREKSKSRLFDQSIEFMDGDSLAVSTDTSSFVYESALAVLPSVNDFEVEEIVEDSQASIAPVDKSLNSSTNAPDDSDISGIASLSSTPEPKSTISNYEMMISHTDDFGHNDEDTLKDSQFEEVRNYSSITISSNENLDTSDAGSLNSDLIEIREPSLEKSEDEMEEIRRDSKRRMSLDIEPKPETFVDSNYSRSSNSMHRLTQILNIDERRQEAPESYNTSQIQNTEEEEVISVNAEIQISDEEASSSSIQAIEDEIGNGSSLILAMDQEDETTNELSVIEKKVNKTLTLSETPAKITENSESLQTIVQIESDDHVVQIEEIQNYEEIDHSEIEDDVECPVTEKIEIVSERKSKRISLRQGTPVVSGNSSARKSKFCQLPKIRINDQTIQIDDSEDTDASTASDNKSKRTSKLFRTPVKNSPASSEARSTRKSKISQTQTIELNDSEDTDDASTTSDSKSKRNEKLLETPVKNSPAVSVTRSARKLSIRTPSLQEDSDCNTSGQISEDIDTSGDAPDASGDRSTTKSQVNEDEVISFEDYEDTDSLVLIENASSIEHSPVAADVRSIRKSKIVETSSSQDDDIKIQDVLVSTDRKSKRISKVLQTSLIPDSPLTTSEVGLTRKSKDFQTSALQNEEGFESDDSEDLDGSIFTENNSKRESTIFQTSSVQQTPTVDKARSTRKSKIVQTPSLQGDEIVESASGRKSRRISNVPKMPSVSDTSISSEVGSAKKSKIFQTPLLEDEEALQSGDEGTSKLEDAEEMDDSISTPSPQSSPAVAEVKSTRKSKIIQTPSLQSDEITEVASGRKSRRISNVLKTPSVSGTPISSGVVSSKKSKIFQTPLLEDEETLQSGDEETSKLENAEETDDSILTPSPQYSPAVAEVKSTRKSKIVQTPSLQGDEIVESTSGRKSRRISNVLKTPSVSGTPISSGVGSSKKSKIFQTPLLEDEETSQSEDEETSKLEDSDEMDDSILTEHKSRCTSTLLQTPSTQPSPAVRSTRKSKIVQTPSLQSDEIAEVVSGRKSRRISNVLKTPSVSGTPISSGVGSSKKSKIFQIPLLEDEEASQSRDEETSKLEDAEEIDDSISTPSPQSSPAVAEVKSTRKSKIVQTPSLQSDEITEVASGRKSRRISNLVKTPSVSGTPIGSGVGSSKKSKIFQTPLLEDEETLQSGDEETSKLENAEQMDDSILTPSPQYSPAVVEVKSTRKSKIVQTPSLQSDEIAEVASGRKSRRISNVLKTPSVSGTPISSGVGSSKKSKIFQTPLLEDEEASQSGDEETSKLENAEEMDDSILTPSPQYSPAVAEIKSTRKSKIVQTPSLQSDEIAEVASSRKSRRISNVLKTPSVSGSPISSGVGSSKKSKIFQTPLLEDEEASQSRDKEPSKLEDAEEMDDSISTPSPQYSPAVAEVKSTRKSKIIQTPSLQSDEIAEVASGRKSRRISNVLKTPSVSGTPISSEIGSSKKSKIFQTPLLEDEEASQSEDKEPSKLEDTEEMDDSILTGHKSKRISTLLQTPSTQPSPAVAEVRSTRKSKIVPTPSLPDDNIVEPEDTLAATNRKSKRISKALQTSSISDSPDTSEVDSTTKSQVLETFVFQDEVSDSSDSESMDDSVFPENNSRNVSTILQASSTQHTPAAVEGRSTRKSKIAQTPSISGTPITSGVGSTRKSKVLQTPLSENVEAFESGDSEDVDSSISTKNESKRTSTLVQTPSMQRSSPVTEIRSNRKSKIVESQDTLALTDRKSKRISKALQTSSISNPLDTFEVDLPTKSQVLETPVLQDEAYDSSGSEDMDDLVFSDISRRESTLLQAQPVQLTPTTGRETSLQDHEIVESEDTFASGRKSTRISNVLKTPSVLGTPITSGVGTARKSKIFETPLLEDEEVSKSGDDEEVDDSILTTNKSRRTSTLLQTPSMQPSPAVVEVRSTRKSKIVSTSSSKGNTDEEADESRNTSPIAANKSRISKLSSTPIVQTTPAPSGVRSVRKSKIVNTPLLQNEEISDRKSKRISKVIQTPSKQISPVSEDDTEGTTNAVALDVLDASANKSSAFQTGSPRRSSLEESADSEVTAIESDRKSKRSSKIPSLQNTPTVLGVLPTRKSKILQTPLSENEITETETLTLLQTPSSHDLPTTSGVRSTRKSNVSKTLLSNTVETEEIDTPMDKSKLLSTPQSSPVVSGVRSTRKSKISVTPIVLPVMQTRRGSKVPHTPVVQEEANTSTTSASKSKRTSKLLQTNSDNTPIMSGIQVKRTSRVLKTPSMQDFNKTNSPLVSGMKSKRISKLQQTPLIQEEADLLNVSERKSGTPKYIEKSKTSVSSAIKPQRISKAFETPSLIDFEENESPLASPVKSRNTSKVLTFNTPTDKDESEIETSPAPKRRKIGGRIANTEPHNDLTNVQGVKTLFKTPKVQKQPHNDLTDVLGVKNILKTPKAVKESKNDLTNVKGVKKLMATPKVQKSPANDLTNVGGVKKLLKTPRQPKEPRNDLTDIQGVKKLMATPTEQKSPQNDLSDVRGVKQLVTTPKPRKSANLSGLGDFFATTSKTTTPKHGLSELRGVKKILDIKKSKSLKVQNSPKNDLTNVVGVKKMFAEEEAEYNRDFNVSGVAEIMNKSDELFDSLLNKKPLKTYGRKSTQLKLDTSVTIGVVSGTPVMSEEVVNWVNTQDFNKGDVVDNLTPIKSKNNENHSVSKKQDVEIHSSTPLNKGNRGILKEKEENIHQDVESSDTVHDKNLKKVQFLDDSNLRKSKRTPRTPSKIATEFVMTNSRSRKRKVEEDDNLNEKSAKVSKVASESNDKNVILDSETDPEDAVVRKVLTKKGAKKPPKSRSKKTTPVNSDSDKVEEENVDNNQEDEKVEAPKITRGRAIRKTTKKNVEVENTEEINASDEENVGQKTEIGKIEAPKTTRSRSGRKINAKTTKKMEEHQIENNEENKTSEKVEENFDENEEIEAPKTTQSRQLKKANIKTSKDENSIEEIEAPKTRRGRLAKKTNTKESKKVEKVENSTNDDEEIEIPENTPSVAPKKTKAKTSKTSMEEVLKASLTEEKNESLKKTTRSRKMEKKSEPEKQLDSSVEILSDEEKDEPVIKVPRKTRGRPVSKTIEEKKESLKKITRSRKMTKQSEPEKQLDSSTEILSDEENGESVIEVPKKTRGRLASKTIEEKKESLKKITRSRKMTKQPEPEKQLDSSTEILSNEENDESVIEVPKKTRGRPVSKTIEEKKESLKKITRSRKMTKQPEPEKQLYSSVEILSDEENDESVIEVPKKTRERQPASKTNKKVPEKSTRLRAAPKGKKVAEVETSINSTFDGSKAKVEETSVRLSKTTRTRGIKRSLEVESINEQENSITANSKKNSKRLKVENDNQFEKELEVSKTTRRRPVVTKASPSHARVIRANKNSIKNSEMEDSKNGETNKAVRGRKTKAEVQSESKNKEEESKTSKTRGKRKLYSLSDSIKIDVEEVEVQKVVRTRNTKEKVEVVAPVRSSKRTRK